MNQPSSYGHLLSTLAILLAAPVLMQCGTHEAPSFVGCELPSDCASPYVCLNHLCIPSSGGIDTGQQDTGQQDTGQQDTGQQDTDQQDTDQQDATTDIGLESCVTVSPEVIEWGLQQVGEQREHDLRVANCGETRVFLEEPRTNDLTGNGWNIWNNGPNVIQPGEWADFTVEIHPSMPGEIDAAVVIETSASQLIVPMTGEVWEAERPIACLRAPEQLQMGSLTLPGVVVGSINVENCGVDVSVDWTLTGPNADVFSIISGPRELGPDQADDVFIEFAPNVPGAYSAALVVVGGSSLSSLIPFEAIVALRATAVESSTGPCVEVTPEFLDFGTLDRGLDTIGFVDVHNCGTRTISFDRATTEGDERDFIAAPRPSSVDPGRSTTLVFGARGDRLGDHHLTYHLPVTDTAFRITVDVESTVE